MAQKSDDVTNLHKLPNSVKLNTVVILFSSSLISTLITIQMNVYAAFPYTCSGCGVYKLYIYYQCRNNT